MLLCEILKYTDGEITLSHCSTKNFADLGRDVQNGDSRVLSKVITPCLGKRQNCLCQLSESRSSAS